MLPDLMPDNWEETEAYARKVFGDHLAIVQSSRQLTPEELKDLSDLIDHLLITWRKHYTEEPIPLGVQALQGNFARVFGLPPSAVYKSVLERALPTGYFAERGPHDLELDAFAHIMTYNSRLRDEARRRGEIPPSIVDNLDFSGLVNPDWRPPH